MITVIGLDIAKNVFQVHGIDDAGQPVLKRKLRRNEVLRVFSLLEPALVGIEACHTAHYWAREIAALGHKVRLMPPQFVKPYVTEERRGRCRGDLRSGAATDHALRADQGRRPTSRSPAPSNSRPSDPAAQQSDQRHQSPLRRVRYRRGPKNAQHRPAARAARR